MAHHGTTKGIALALEERVEAARVTRVALHVGHVHRPARHIRHLALGPSHIHCTGGGSVHHRTRIHRSFGGCVLIHRGMIHSRMVHGRVIHGRMVHGLHRPRH